MSVRLFVSVTAERAASLMADGPRRDFVEIAKATGGEIVYAPSAGGTRFRKAFGPHVRQAWSAARACRAGDSLFLDGEHIGLPALVFLRLLGRRPGRIAMLGHFVSRPWKRALFWLATRVGPGGVLLVHSERQLTNIRRVLGRRWSVEFVPYHVDCRYWTPAGTPPATPTIVSAGSENRDYECLVEAARGLDTQVVIAAGSHWARTLAGATDVPPNVTYLSDALPFAALRELYQRAMVVVVPLRNVANQSGVTTMLEAMACGVPIVVSATAGQREVLEAPLCRADGHLDTLAMADRGPLGRSGTGPAGLYVPISDSAALRTAIKRLLADPIGSRKLGEAGRVTAQRYFDTSLFVSAVAQRLAASGSEQ